MKYIVVLFSALLLNSSSVYDISLNKISGEPFKLSDFKGKKVLIVNTASRCGYTSQYGDLEKLYQANKDKLEIVGMPCNQFMGQEPGKNAEISKFCKKNYGVTFTLLEKGYVKGSNQHPCIVLREFFEVNNNTLWSKLNTYLNHGFIRR